MEAERDQHAPGEEPVTQRERAMLLGQTKPRMMVQQTRGLGQSDNSTAVSNAAQAGNVAQWLGMHKEAVYLAMAQEDKALQENKVLLSSSLRHGSSFTWREW